ncbi:MAG: hypothetical protein IJR17_02445 [Clostridia bacterium]|nr:hypothetical protein [Clostridia bacterium]
MKLAAGGVLFLLCVLMGEGASRKTARREQALGELILLLQRVGDRQQHSLCSYESALLQEPPSSLQRLLLSLLRGTPLECDYLTEEERNLVRDYARQQFPSLQEAGKSLNQLLHGLSAAQAQAAAQRQQKGRLYRSMGYLSGVAALLLVV